MEMNLNDILDNLTEEERKLILIKTKEDMNNILKELWKDATEEPKEYWWINGKGEVLSCIKGISEDSRKSIGNYFNTREEAELAVRKLKAWKRLKDNGFKFNGINEYDGSIKTLLTKQVKIKDCVEFYEDMTLLFGGEK